jgi:curved DNA-binding protein CbpA
MNFYAVLGVPPDADEHMIRTAYRYLARRYHPDRGEGSSAEKFRLIQQAYETLIKTAGHESHDLSPRWTQRASPAYVEPLSDRAPSIYQEDARVFGRWEVGPQATALAQDPWDIWIEDIFSDFWGPIRPW